MTKTILTLLSLLCIPALSLAQGIGQDTGQDTGKESLYDQQVAEQEKVWLNVGEQQQLAFYLTESSGTAYGGVLLIPDIAKHPATLGSINTMRIALSKHHWSTLALNMGGANEAQSLDLIAAGIQFFNEKEIYNIAILGEGRGAAHAILYLASKPPTDANSAKTDRISALIMVDAHNSTSDNEAHILQKLAEVAIPVLDAFSNGDYIEQRQADKRKDTARETLNKTYHQVRLPQASGEQQNGDNRVTKRIRGWLDKNIANLTAPLI